MVDDLCARNLRYVNRLNPCFVPLPVLDNRAQVARWRCGEIEASRSAPDSTSGTEDDMGRPARLWSVNTMKSKPCSPYQRTTSPGGVWLSPERDEWR